MSRHSIEMDFDRAMRQADQIDNLAELLRNTNKNYVGTLQNINAGWKGENANEYIRKGYQLQSKINSTYLELTGIASDIRRIARRVYEAELRALELAGTD